MRFCRYCEIAQLCPEPGGLHLSTCGSCADVHMVNNGTNLCCTRRQHHAETLWCVILWLFARCLPFTYEGNHSPTMCWYVLKKKLDIVLSSVFSKVGFISPSTVFCSLLCNTGQLNCDMYLAGLCSGFGCCCSAAHASRSALRSHFWKTMWGICFKVFTNSRTLSSVCSSFTPANFK